MAPRVTVSSDTFGVHSLSANRTCKPSSVTSEPAHPPRNVVRIHGLKSARQAAFTGASLLSTRARVSSSRAFCEDSLSWFEPSAIPMLCGSARKAAIVVLLALSAAAMRESARDAELQTSSEWQPRRVLSSAAIAPSSRSARTFSTPRAASAANKRSTASTVAARLALLTRTAQSVFTPPCSRSSLWCSCDSSAKLSRRLTAGVILS
eukprot:Amastigsp_a676561_5.p3 type:complete len:207 gc:universal Amastigsp_a676561_5:795-175(-)